MSFTTLRHSKNVRAGKSATISCLVLLLLFASATSPARAQVEVTVPGNASGHFGNTSDVIVPFVPAITVKGPASIQITYVSGTVTGSGGVNAGPKGVTANTNGQQSPLQEKAGLSGGTIPDLDALIGIFFSNRIANPVGFQAVDGTKGSALVGLVPYLLFSVGEGLTYEAPAAGTLYLGINNWKVSGNGGGFVVDVTVVQQKSYDAAAQFSATANPNGVWSYGWSQSTGATFHLYTQQLPFSGVYNWSSNCCGAPSGPPSVGYNPTNASITPGTYTYPAHTVFFHPGPEGQNSVLRWTAPLSGNYQLKAVFWGDDFVGPTTTDVHVLHNGLGLYTAEVTGYGPSSDQSFTTTVSLAAGDTIDFTVGDGTDGNYFFDNTGVSAVITPE